VFTTFCMKTMVPLRVVAILSNCSFLVYASIGGLYPILILHGFLLPLNVFRLVQIRRMVRQVTDAATGDLSLDWLVPMMSRRRFASGETLFRKGDSAHEVFVVAKGLVRVHGLDRTVGPGNLVGEIGVFSPDRRRTQTVSCETDVEAFALSDQKMYELYYQNPKLGFYLMHLIVGRLLEGAPC
jgi:CRP/FNR family transcriptional regulator, cyclic AMP receptor protein